jgi:hypothetical protein
MKTSTSKQVDRAIREGYRSGLEDKVAQQLNELAMNYEYEPKDGRIQYTKPEKPSKYTPDFVFPNCPIIIEAKGRFVTADRQKHLLIKEQHPELDIRFVFSNSKGRISKQSATTYGMWCEKYGFKYADKTIPDEWVKEIKKWQRSH